MNMITDLSAVTTISPASTQKILSKFQDCLCYAVQEALGNHETEIELDIYIGKLMIEVIDDVVQYKFVPSASFERDVSDTVISGVCPMFNRVENAIQGKIMGAYKELY